MDALSVLSVLIGVLIIATRGPLIFAPAATLRRFRSLVSTDRRVRAMAASFVPLVVALIALPLGEGAMAVVLRCFGWLWAAIAVWLLVAPGSYRRMANGIFDFLEQSADTATTRVIGAVATALGAALVYYGVAVA